MLADWIANHEGLGVSVDGANRGFAQGAWYNLGISVDEILNVIGDFTAASERSEIMLALMKS